jgi:hypothetical protein
VFLRLCPSLWGKCLFWRALLASPLGAPLGASGIQLQCGPLPGPLHRTQLPVRHTLQYRAPSIRIVGARWRAAAAVLFSGRLWAARGGNVHLWWGPRWSRRLLVVTGARCPRTKPVVAAVGLRVGHRAPLQPGRAARHLHMYAEGDQLISLIKSAIENKSGAAPSLQGLVTLC